MHKKDHFFVLGIGIVVLLFLVGFIALPKQSVSVAERRKLADKPVLTIKTIADGTYMENMESYLLDHFPERDLFRRLYTSVNREIFRKKDVNGYVQRENMIFHLEDTMNSSKVAKAVATFQNIKETYFKEQKTYYAMIPDKSFFLEDSLGYSRFAYEEVLASLQEGLSDSQYIDLFDTVSLKDYYQTDLHWKQECIAQTAAVILQNMKAECETQNYEMFLATDDFKGGYLLSSAYSNPSDQIYYLQNEELKDVSVYDYETQNTTEIYHFEKIGSGDDYDFFLNGARAMLQMENPNCKNGKSLILFRDSFGSSIAPLLIPAYEKITLIDIRYVTADYALSLIDWDTKTDILFLYQITMLNHSDSFR